MEKEEKTTKKNNIFINVFIIFFIIILASYLYARNIEPSLLLTKEYKISNELIPNNFSGIKIVHITDIYFGNTTHEKELKKLVNHVNRLKPDLVLFTGNLIKENKKLTEETKNSIIKNLKSINASLGKYSIKGNADFNEYYEEIMNESDFVLLNNTYDLIYNDGLTPIYICGLSSYLKDNIDLEACNSFFNETNENLYKIVLTHEGDSIDNILSVRNNINLILAGNSLNGTLSIPYYGPYYLPKGSKKYYSPYYKKDNTEIFISSGIGTDKYHYRFNNAPSINFYRLKSIQ